MSINFPITWRLRECMAKAKIDSALELHRRMKGFPDSPVDGSR